MRVLSNRYRIHVMYQCRCCTWGSIAALGMSLTSSEIRAIFSCPVHPRETKMKILDRNLTENRGKK